MSIGWGLPFCQTLCRDDSCKLLRSSLSTSWLKKMQLDVGNEPYLSQQKSHSYLSTLFAIKTDNYVNVSEIFI